MKEDQQDAQGHHIAYGELIDGEEALIDCTVVGELIADGMLIDKPANKQACKESAHRQLICAVMKSQKSSSDMPKRVSPSTAPIDSEQKTAISEQTTVRTHAAFFLPMFSSSVKKAVPISCIEMVDVRAANTSSA